MMRRPPWPSFLTCLALLTGSLACAPAYDAPGLYEDLQDADPEVRLDAREKINRLIADGNYRVFVRGLDSPVPIHKVQSILYLADMRQAGARKALRALLASDRRMMLPFNPIRLKPTTEEHDSRIMVAHLIRTTGGDPEALPVLLEGLDPSQDPDIVMGACFAIGALRDTGGIPFLASAGRSPEIEVARAAVQALGQFEKPDIRAALQEALSHPSPQVRGDVLTIIEPAGDPAELEMVRRLAASDPDETLRVSAIERLSVSPDASITGFLIDLLDSESPSVRAAAAQALALRTGQNLGEDRGRWARWLSRQPSAGKDPGR